MITKKIVNIRSFRPGMEIYYDGMWRRIETVSGPKRGIFCTEACYHIRFHALSDWVFRTRDGMLVPSWTTLYRGDEIKVCA